MQRALATLLFLISAQAGAHSQSTTYLQITVGDGSLHGQWAIPLRDLASAMKIDPARGHTAEAEVTDRLNAIANYALPRLHVAGAGASCPLYPARHERSGVFAVIRFRADCDTASGPLDVRYELFFDLDPAHLGLIRVQHQGVTHVGTFATDQRARSFEIDQTDGWEQFRQYTVQGVWHIWIGYDHILFLLVLLLAAVLRRDGQRWLPAKGLKSTLTGVAVMVTSFTVAHSLTLSAAVLGLIAAPAKLVEGVIAASVIVAAANNLHPFLTRHVWLVTFVFGLVHGLGFASVLQGLGLQSHAIAMPLLGFNAGVEIGQLAVVAAVVPVLYLARRTRFYARYLFPIASGTAAGLASLWLIERVSEVEILAPALSMMTSEKLAYGAGILLAVVVGGAAASRWLRHLFSLRVPVTALSGWTSAVSLIVSGLLLGYVATNVNLTDADRRASILARLVPGTPSGADERLVSVVSRIQKSAPESVVTALVDGKPSPAHAFLRARLGTARQRGEKIEAMQLALDSSALLEHRHPTQAIKALEEAVAYDPQAVPAWRHLARLRQAHGDYTGAAAALEDALAVSTELEPAVVARDTERLADLRVKAGDSQRAEEAYREAIRRQQGPAAAQNLARLYRKLGDALIDGNRLAAARGAYLQALVIHEANGDTVGGAHVHAALARYYTARGELAKARDLYEVALKGLEQSGSADHASERARVYGHLGRAQRRLGDLDGALTAYHKAIELDAQTGNQARAAIGYSNLGIVHQLREEYTQAEDAFKQALAINQRLNRAYGEAANQANLGNVYRLQAKVVLARKAYERSRRLFDELDAVVESRRVAGWSRMLASAEQ